MNAWEIGGLSLLLVLILIGLGTVALVLTIRGLIRYVAARTVDRVVQAGERQLMKGVGQVAKTVAEEVRKNDPKRLEPEVARLAETRKGVVTVADVMAACDVSKLVAQECLGNLVRKKVCKIELGKGESLSRYVFESFRQKRTFLACDYCETEFGTDATGSSCPNCGGKLTQKTALVE